MSDRPRVISDPSEWKYAMRSRLDSMRMSRYEFVRKCVEEEICSRHTAECLMADDGTVTGQRKPSLENAISMARVLGFDLVMVPRPRRSSK
jgi:hypothetical protein